MMNAIRSRAENVLNSHVVECTGVLVRGMRHAQVTAGDSEGAME